MKDLPVDSHAKPTSTTTPITSSGEHKTTEVPTSAIDTTPNLPTEEKTSPAPSIDKAVPPTKPLEEKSTVNATSSSTTQKETPALGTDKTDTKLSSENSSAPPPDSGKEANKELAAILEGGKHSKGVPENTPTGSQPGATSEPKVVKSETPVAKETSKIEKETSPSPDGKNGKVKLTDKIKAKLHIHGKDKE